MTTQPPAFRRPPPRRRVGDPHFDVHGRNRTRAPRSPPGHAAPPWPPKVNERAPRRSEFIAASIWNTKEKSAAAAELSKARRGLKTFIKSTAKHGIEVYQPHGELRSKRIMMCNVGGDQWVMWGAVNTRAEAGGMSLSVLMPPREGGTKLMSPVASHSPALAIYTIGGVQRFFFPLSGTNHIPQICGASYKWVCASSSRKL